MEAAARQLSQAERIALLPARERRRFLASLKDKEMEELLVRWCHWMRAAQEPPVGDWRVWLLMAGRGFGKTRAGAEWVHHLAEEQGRRIALVGPSEEEVRAVMIEGASGLLASAPADAGVQWEPSRGVLRWKSGAEAFVYSGANPEKLRGSEHDFAWCDELGKWAKPEASWDNLMLGLRRGRFPRVLATTTPRPIPLMRQLIKRADVAVTRGRTADNVLLAAGFVSYVTDLYGGTRLGRQELDGELIDDIEGSLWKRDLIERCRVVPLPAREGIEGAADAAEPLSQSSRNPPPTPLLQGGEFLSRVVVGVDPPAGVDGDACGIVAAGLGRDGLAYVLGDHSVRGLSPAGWAAAVADAVELHGADLVVAEANNGGAMIESVLRAARTGLPVRLVHASRGKVARAEPVSALFTGGRARFAGVFPELEDELAGLTIGGGYEGPGRSPDRADAMVWAMTELMLGRPAREPRVMLL